VCKTPFSRSRESYDSAGERNLENNNDRIGFIGVIVFAAASALRLVEKTTQSTNFRDPVPAAR
jgi:hypothetical protein